MIIDSADFFFKLDHRGLSHSFTLWSLKRWQRLFLFSSSPGCTRNSGICQHCSAQRCPLVWNAEIWVSFWSSFSADSCGVWESVILTGINLPWETLGTRAPRVTGTHQPCRFLEEEKKKNSWLKKENLRPHLISISF